MSAWDSIRTHASKTLLLLVVWLSLAGAGLQTRTPIDEVRRYTRPLEFEFAGWTLKALAIKLGQFASGRTSYLSDDERLQAVHWLLLEVEQAQRLQNELAQLFGQPELEDRQEQIEAKRQQLALVEYRLARGQAMAEAVLQEQLATVLAELGLALAGQPVPPVAFHMTELPFALIVSPRGEIRQQANIQLETGLTAADWVRLESSVESGLDVSALVVPVGGYGTYPTMVQRSGDLNWVSEIVAHEWIHNYLTTRPLGLRYDVSDDLRTMNETAATLLGQTLGRMVVARYYPDQLPPPPADEPAIPLSESAAEPQGPPPFDFRAEMRETRERVDGLLASGEISQAEAYMESRRLVFWEQGYRLRRLNQAYFAFHGSYAGEPGGAAGDDPVGAAVRDLWQSIVDPVRFLRTMAWMTGPDDLAQALGRPIPPG
ncbi:MAG TPA: hypothetical protein VGA52_05330 [Anaerolineales bacterium]